jgi:hypothetical protein
MHNGTALPATLSVDSNARLPASYETARTAIAECARIDECKTWSDKAAALAAYARQAKDDSLAVYARRIQARALRRAGELLKDVPRGDEATRYGRDGTVPPGDSTSYENPVGRAKAADQAGLSERQRKTALRVAAIPAEEFDCAIESQAPPTVTELAARGTESRPPSETQPEPEGLTPEEEAEEWANFEREYAASIDKVMASDDYLTTAHEEIKRQAAMIVRLTWERDGFSNGKDALEKLLRAEQRKADRFAKEVTRLEGEVQRLEGENEALRERVAIMEGA